MHSPTGVTRSPWRVSIDQPAQAERTFLPDQ